MNRFHSIIKELLYPPRCPICDEILAGEEGAEHICRECRGQIRYIREPRCMKCGAELTDASQEYCKTCAMKKHVYDRGLALFRYESVRTSVYRLKYRGRKEYAEFYGREMARCFAQPIRYWKPEVLIPVPMHKAKERARGYNQATALAEVMGRYCGIPVRTDLVERRRKTRPMKELNAGERQINLKNAFHISQDVVKLKTVMLVDDIYTTGSTIDEIAKGLRAAGVAKVYYVALAIGSGQ